MALGKTVLGKAAAEVERVQDQVAQWTAEAETARAELVDLEGRVGAEVLDDAGAAAGLSESLSGLRARVDVADRAVVAAGERLVEARREVLRARARELRDEAGRQRRDAEKRQRRTAEMLAALTEWEGATYVPWEPARGAALAQGEPVTYRVPRTRAMLQRADVLEREAVHLEKNAGLDVAAVERVSVQVMASVAG